MSCIEAPRTPDRLTLPAQTFESDGIFWLDPKVIEDAGSLINSTHLATMALGAESRSMENPVMRSSIHDMFVPEDDPLHDELIRAIDIGFMYGSLIATKSHSNQQDQTNDVRFDAHEKIPMTLLAEMEKAKHDLDLYSSRDNYELFMRLRNLEVRRAHSDILAYSLASTQDHVGNEFERNRLSDEMYDTDTLRRFQTLFYAGALAGGLLHSSPEDLRRPRVEIIRSMIGYVEPISRRKEMPSDREDGKSLEAIIDGELSAKLSFSIQRPHNAPPFIAVYPGSLQYGPNVLSSPVYDRGAEEPMALKKIPFDELDAVIIEKYDHETKKVTEIVLVDDPEVYLEIPDADSEIVGLLLDKLCITKYDSVHPNGLNLKHLVEAFKGKKAKDIDYANGIVAGEPFKLQRRYAWLAGLGIAGIWLTDYFISNNGAEVDWQSDAAYTGLFATGLIALSVIGKRLNARIKETEQNYQSLLDRNNSIL